jgi:Holliday junction resolvase RusA-like endonuclease
MIFTLNLPPTTNEAYKINNNRMYKTQEFKAWETESLWKIKQCHVEDMILGPVSLSIAYYVKFPRDWDGGNKFVSDLLEDAHVYKNDSQVIRAMIYKIKDKDFPRCEIQVVEL